MTIFTVEYWGAGIVWLPIVGSIVSAK